MGRKEELNNTEKSLLAGMQEALAYVKGEKTKAKTHEVVLADIDPKKVRQKTKMSQKRFSETFLLPVSNVRNWEQGTRAPDQAARVLLALIEKHPNQMEEFMRELG